MFTIVHYCGSIDIRLPLGLFAAVAYPSSGPSTYNKYYAKGWAVRLARGRFIGVFKITTVSVCFVGVYTKASELDYDDIEEDGVNTVHG